MTPQKLGALLVLLEVVFGSASRARGQQASFFIGVAGDGSASFPTTLTGNYATKLTTTNGCINPSCLTCYERDGIPGNGTLALTATPGFQYVVRGFYSADSQVQKVTLYHGFDNPMDVAPTTPQGDVTVNVTDTSQYTAVLVFGAGASDPSTVEAACSTPTTSTTTLPSQCTDPLLPVACDTICCPVGNTCNTRNSQLCCELGESVSCLGRCCPNSFQCGFDDTSCSCSGSSSGSRVSFFHGEMTINGALPVCGQTLQPGDLIEVLPGGSAMIFLEGAFLTDSLTCTLSSFEKTASLVFKPQDNFGVRVVKLIRGVLGIDSTGLNRVEALNTVVGTEGTKFSIDANPDTQQDTIAVTEDAVLVTPKNPALPPFMLNARQQVVVRPDKVGPSTLLCLPRQRGDGVPYPGDTLHATLLQK